jgi:unsaturated chondroitin disaccharide hydrolase
MPHSTPTYAFRDALNFAQQQVRRLIESHPGFYPLYTDNGRWKHDKPAWTHWCDGFLPGMMWLFLESATADDPSYWRKKAEEYSARLEDRKEDRDVHDLGFIFYHGTYKRWYDATLRDGHPDQRLKDVVLRAGQVLAMRFKDKGQYLRSFISDESIFIDIMMNVPIIFYAANELKDEKLMKVAMNHSLTTRRVLLRGDGSTSHEGIFDTNTGEFLRQTTHQGFRGDSCWSRGLAWSLYGFATCYELTRDIKFLAAAEQNADFWITHTPHDGVPPWDYDAPTDDSAVERERVYLDIEEAIASALRDHFKASDVSEFIVHLNHTTGDLSATRRGEPVPLNILGRIAAQTAKQTMLEVIQKRGNIKLSRSQPDSSAAAIAACGLFTLAKLTTSPTLAIAYRELALRTVNTLCHPPYLATDDKNWEGILKRGVYHIHKGLGEDESVMWGEFFFVEALTKALTV